MMTLFRFGLARPITILCLLLIHVRPLFAAGPTIAVSAGPALLQGHATYRIGGLVDRPDHGYVTRFPLSELKFPTNVFTSTVKVRGQFRQRVRFDLAVMAGPTRTAGSMRNSDWGVNALEFDWWPLPDSLDVRSLSDARLKAFQADIALRLRLHEKIPETSGGAFGRPDIRWSFFGGIGHRYQKLDYTLHNVEQWYPSLNEYYDTDLGRDRATGLAGTYEVVFHIPYLQVAAEMEMNRRFTVDVGLAYAPHAWIRDHDGHLLRDPRIFAKGRCTGDAVLLNAATALRFAGRWRLAAGMEYMYTHARGRQKNYINAAWVWTTDETVTSEQFRGDVAISLEF